MFAQVLFFALAAVSEGAQPSAPAPIAAPLRKLPWAQLNFLHTTDTHGWHAGHLQEPSYSADWGDVVSLAKHMRDRADKEGVDFLVIDTGDRVEGNGLYDASEPKGKYTFDIVKQLDIDILCAGNHELYKANASNNEFTKTIPNFKGNYLASNLDIRKNGSDGFQPLAPRYRRFKTKNQGIRITAFGFMFDFQGSSPNTKVTPVEDAVKEQWFQNAIRETVDLFVVIGHVPLKSLEFDAIFKAIRAAKWDAPIHFFGGHTHIRDYAKYDTKAYAIESGRYLETIGFASIAGLNSEKKKIDTSKSDPTFKRLYIDNNLYSFQAHTGLNETTFPTAHGQNVSAQIASARKALKLDDKHGCAPRDLWLSRVPANHTNSIFKWLHDEVVPDQFTDAGKGSQPKLVITNTGSIRFDIFKGPFTRDTTYLVAPFTSGFRYIKGVPRQTAVQLLPVLNANAPMLQAADPSLDPSLLLPPVARSSSTDEDSNFSSFSEFDESNQQALADKPLTPGYTTKDDAGTDGDDTLHSKISYYKVPNCIQSRVDFPPNDKDVQKIDVVYNEFLQPWVILALRFLGSSYDQEDTAAYLDGQPMTDIINNWVENHWPCNDKDEL